MTKKALFVISLFMFVCSGASAQGAFFGDMGGAKNLSIGYAPFGYDHIKISMDDEKYKYDYKPYMNVNLGYEMQTGGMGYIAELAYSKGTFDKYDLTGVSQWFNPSQKENVTSFALSYLFGNTINKFHRLQVPIYFGPRFEYISGGPFHNLTFNACLKARIKLYITNKVGIYVGGTALMGWGSKKAHDKSSSSSDHYNITPKTAYADAGLILQLN